MRWAQGDKFTSHLGQSISSRRLETSSKTKTKTGSLGPSWRTHFALRWPNALMGKSMSGLLRITYYPLSRRNFRILVTIGQQRSIKGEILRRRNTLIRSRRSSSVSKQKWEASSAIQLFVISIALVAAIRRKLCVSVTKYHEMGPLRDGLSLRFHRVVMGWTMVTLTWWYGQSLPTLHGVKKKRGVF